MSDFKPRAGTFLPYMEYTPRDKRAGRSAPGSPLTLLEILQRQAQQTLPVFDLQALGSMPPQQYANALKDLKDAGFIEIAGEAPEQVVKLTDSGAKVVQLAKPA